MNSDAFVWSVSSLLKSKNVCVCFEIVTGHKPIKKNRLKIRLVCTFAYLFANYFTSTSVRPSVLTVIGYPDRLSLVSIYIHLFFNTFV